MKTEQWIKKNIIWLMLGITILFIFLIHNKQFTNIPQMSLNDIDFNEYERHPTIDGSCTKESDCPEYEHCLAEDMKCHTINEIGNGCYQIYDFNGKCVKTCDDTMMFDENAKIYTSKEDYCKLI